MDKLLLIDGHHMLFKMFYGMPSRIMGKENKPIQAIVGFLGAMIKILKHVEPSYVFVIFDGENGSDRTVIDSQYKKNRIDYHLVEEQNNPFSQLDGIKNVLDYLKIKYCETDGIEADDLIAGYVSKYQEELEIYIVSNDTDFLQLINSNVYLYIYRGKNTIIYDEDKVIEKYGVKPSQFVDYKILVGDQSDHIKGVPKIGMKTAVRLLNKYQNITNIIKNIEDIFPLYIQLSLKENIDRIRINRKLIELTKKVFIPMKLKEMSYSNMNEWKTMKILKEMDIL